MQILVLATLAAGLFFCTNSASASAVRVAQDRLQQLTSSFDDEFEKYAVRVSEAAGTVWSAKSTRRGRSQRGRHLADCPTGSTVCGTTCTDTTGDDGNCGSCGNVCPAGNTCCNSLCVDVKHYSTNCGECGKVCSGTCSNGLCNYGA